MSGHFLAQLLLLFLLVYADTVFSKMHYITPSLDGPCPPNSSCLTLSQFAANSSYIETDTSLLFLPGNHTLDRELLLAQVNNFSMTMDGAGSETIFVECSTHSRRFHISETTSVSIHGLHFIGCGSNNVSQVNWLTINSSTFQGVQEGNTVLVLNEVSAATIVRCSFLSNSLLYLKINISTTYTINEFLDYIYFQRSTPSGMLYVAFSNISVISSKFMHNRADIGGALVAHSSTLHLARSTYSNNTANFGGVMVTSGSTIDMDNNTFINNVAQIGGAMVTYNDTFTISSTTFNNNSAEAYRFGAGGVMITSGDSSFTISNSTFSNNTADGSGVMATSGDSSLNISNSTFSNNTARYGGVLYTFGGSSVNISTSVFVNNKATTYGGVFWCSDGTLNVDNSNFSLNAVSSQGEGLIFIRQCSTHITNGTFDQNNGSLYTFNSNLNFSGHLTFENSMEPVIAGNGGTSQEGGAITSFQSTVIFTRESVVRFSNNRASDGGALLATESTITVYGETTIANNMANSSGGGISLKQSRLEIKGMCQFVNNVAVRGGGIHASSSTIAVYQPGTLQVINNSAKFGKHSLL